MFYHSVIHGLSFFTYRLETVVSVWLPIHAHTFGTMNAKFSILHEAECSIENFNRGQVMNDHKINMITLAM